jgi:TIR domain/NB-ARC domain
MAINSSSVIKIFLCYAREDEDLRQSLEKQLRALRRQGLINIWHDRMIHAGVEWEGEINTHLDTAQIILLLISPDFIDSDYCYGIEMRRAMERHLHGEAHVIPIILRPTLWQGTPFGRLQALPTDAIPIISRKWHNQDEAFFNTAAGIKKVIEDFFSRQREKEQFQKELQGDSLERRALDQLSGINSNKYEGLPQISLPLQLPQEYPSPQNSTPYSNQQTFPISPISLSTQQPRFTTATGSISSVGFTSNERTYHSEHILPQEQNISRHDTEEPTDELWPFNIPNEYYYFLPGRERELKQLLAVLQNPQGAPVIAVDGLGGLGKTALAAELARRALKERLFKGVIGESAKLEDFSGGEFVTVREATLDFTLLLDSIAQQLGHWEIPPLKGEEKYAALIRLLRQHPYVILVDNIETSENASFLVAKLRNFLGNSRAIITSRKQIHYDFVQSLSLRGLELADSLTFLEMDMKQRGVQQPLSLSREKLAEIHDITGGAPLAMKLVVAQARSLNLDLVLKQMQNADSEGLYTYIFRRSWEYLSPVAQRILYYIGKTAIAAVDWEELSNVGIAENEDILIRGINQLADYSLLEVSSLAGEKYYNIHQLTRQFVNGELPKLWPEQGLQ